jgi:cytoskeletal protein CcmA (bactofilin family)
LGKKRKEKKLYEERSKVETILGIGTKVEGDIFTKGSLRVEGRVKGYIKSEGDLYIGESGVLETKIEARKVIIAGTVTGDICALEKIEILPSGKLTGDIRTKSLKIEEGAVFIGSTKPLEDENYIDIDLSQEEAAADKES